MKEASLKENTQKSPAIVITNKIQTDEEVDIANVLNNIIPE